MTQPKKTILVAEDDLAILDVLTLILEDAGYEVRTATNQAILQGVYTEVPDLLLLDIWLSGQNGKDLCIALKNDERTRHLPIILCSANKETRAIAQEAGADDFITKPFDLDKLLQKVEQYVS
jgi:CheY-like chemotaxis protein